jgi:hypothetical protein
MAEHIWTVLCERQLLDPESQVISLVDLRESAAIRGLMEQIEEAVQSGKKAALVDIPTKVVSWWFRSDSTEEVIKARYTFIGPDGKRLLERAADLPWSDNTIFSRLFLQFNKLPITAPGLHWFCVEQQKSLKGNKHKWVTMTKIPLHISPA